MNGEPARETFEPALLQRIETLATNLAREAGAVVTDALQREIQVDYKPDAKGKEADTDPVSEVDRAVEVLIRERVGATFPDHVILGEEAEADASTDVSAPWVWIVDPVDGTANFINGFPLFAVSVGVLYRGQPVVGAIWCATTHALRSGVYHAREGGPLCLDGEPVPQRMTKVRRAVAAAPGGSSSGTRLWDHRVTGSMAIEAAFVAAGIFASAPFWSPKIWDIAAGMVLIRAAGREAWQREGDAWRPFTTFTIPTSRPSQRRRRTAPVSEERPLTLRDWRGHIIVGTPEAMTFIRERTKRESLIAHIWRRIRSRHRRRRG